MSIADVDVDWLIEVGMLSRCCIILRNKRIRIIERITYTPKPYAIGQIQGDYISSSYIGIKVFYGQDSESEQSVD